MSWRVSSPVSAGLKWADLVVGNVYTFHAGAGCQTDYLAVHDTLCNLKPNDEGYYEKVALIRLGREFTILTERDFDGVTPFHLVGRMEKETA